MESEDEYQPQKSDDDTESLPEISLPSLTPTKSKKSADSTNKRTPQNSTENPPRKPPPLLKMDLSSVETLSPIKSITKKEASHHVRETQKLVKKVERLNEECAKQLELNKMDNEIRDVLRKGGIVGLEEERQEKNQKEAEESSKASPDDSSDEFSSLGLPSMEPKGIPYFTNSPDLMCSLDPPPLTPNANESKLEELLRDADHPQLNELIQGDMIAFWYRNHACPPAVMEWLLKVACLFNDVQLSRCACRTLCSLLSSNADNAWQLSLQSIETIVHQLGSSDSVHDDIECGHSQKKVGELVEESDNGYSGRHTSSIAQQLRNMLVILRCSFESRPIRLKPDEIFDFVRIFLRIAVDPLVLCKPLECDVVSALDVFLSTVPEDTLGPAIFSAVSSLLVSLSDPWDKMYIAQMLILTSYCRKTLLRAFCLGCLRNFVGKKSEDERKYLVEGKLFNIAELSLEELCNTGLSVVLLSFIVIFSQEYLASLHFEGFYPLFQVVWVTARLLKDEPCQPTELQEVYSELHHLSGRVKDFPNSIWPSLFKDLLSRIMNTVKPSSSLFEECIAPVT